MSRGAAGTEGMAQAGLWHSSLRSPPPVPRVPRRGGWLPLSPSRRWALSLASSFLLSPPITVTCAFARVGLQNAFLGVEAASPLPHPQLPPHAAPLLQGSFQPYVGLPQ